jgi:hypothetical protein
MPPGTKVLYTTGRTVTDGRITRFVATSAVLEKPYTAEQLLQALSTHFGIDPAAK